jgi:hypothetical protein
MFGIRYPIICGGMFWIGGQSLWRLWPAGSVGFIVGSTFGEIWSPARRDPQGP